MRFWFFVLMVAGFGSSALAEPWEGVFEGTIGKANVLVELSAGEKSDYNAIESSRYSYAGKVYDLNLVLDPNSKQLTFFEIDDVASAFDDIKQGDPRLTGLWEIAVTKDGAKGTWTSPKDKELPINLKRLPLIVIENVPPGENQLSATYNSAWFVGVAFLPSDVAETFGQVEVLMEKDNIFGMTFPVMGNMADGARLDAANAMLHDQYEREIIAMRDCQNGVQKDMRGNGEETMSQVDRKVTFASQTLLSVEMSGSMFCGGAHPSNFASPQTYDLEVAERIGGDTGRGGSDLYGFSRIFKLDDHAERVAFEKFVLGRWSENAAKHGEDGQMCDSSGFMTDSPEGERDFSLSFVKDGLAVRRTDYPHVLSTCLWQDFNPTVIPWAELKPWLKPGQRLLVEEVK